MIAFLYDLLYSLPIFIFAITYFKQFLGLEEAGGFIYALAIVLCIFVAGLFDGKNKLKFLGLGLFSAIVAGIILVHKPEERLAFIEANVWVGWAIGLGCIMLLLGRIIRINIMITLLSALAILSAFVVFLLNGMQLEKISFVALVVQFMIMLADIVQKKWVKTGGEDNQRHLVNVAPFIITVGLLVYIIPTSDKAYDWQLAKNIWQAVVETVKSVSAGIGKRSDEFAEVGYAENVVMSGNVFDNTKDLMLLTTGRKTTPVIYLKGKSYDKYNGRGWESTSQDISKNQMIDLVEIQALINNVDPDYAYDYIKVSYVNIKHDMFSTKYIFAPAKAELYTGQLDDIKYTSYADSLQSSKRLNYADEYNIKFLALNKEQEKFADLVNSKEKITERSWNNAVKKYTSGGYFSCSYEEYLDYVEQTKKLYSQNIEISDELRAELDKVYEGAATDWEKLNRLEEWLGTMAYSTNPGVMPKSVDTPEEFLDYFLLESREGFCVHYATAFVLLARAEGLPARLAQGYYVNHGTKEEVMVTSNMAHTWPEVYFENVGWIPFEPTPGYRVSYTWKVYEPKEQPTYNGEINYFGNDDEYEEPIEEENVEEEEKSFDAKIIIVPVIIFMVFAMAFLVSYRFSISRKYRSLDARRKAFCDCRFLMSALSKAGFKLRQGETLEEYSDRVLEALKTKELKSRAVNAQEPDHEPLDIEEEGLYKDLTGFIKCYEEMLYNALIPDREVNLKISWARKQVLSLVDNRRGHVKFIIRIGLCLCFAQIVQSEHRMSKQ